MSFQSPIPVGTQPRISEISRLAPSRDRNATPKQWQTNNQTTAQVSALTNVTRRLQYQLNLLQGRSLVPSQMHPFKVYNVPQSLCPRKGTYGGNAYDPAKDAWRTFRVRTGNLGYRPIWFLPQDVGFSGAIGSLTGNNYEAVVVIESGSDGNYVSVGPNRKDIYTGYEEDTYSLSTYFGAAQEILFVSGDNGSGRAPSISVSTDGDLATFVLPTSMLNMTDSVVQACFWVQVDGDTDADTPPVFKIWCGAFTPFDETSPFPAGDNIFPLALLSTPWTPGPSSSGITQQFTVNQLEYGHIVGRYPPVGMNYRGNWDDGTITGQVFYPGDVVSILETSHSQTYYTSYIYNQAPAVITDAPIFDLTAAIWWPMYHLT